MHSTTWIVLFALTLPGADDAQESNATGASQSAADDMSTRTRSIYAKVALVRTDFPGVVDFKECPAPPVLPLGGNETKRTAFQQTATLKDGRVCFLSYYVLDSPAKAGEAIRRHAENVSTPSRRVGDARPLGLQDAEDPYVFDRAFGNECFLFRYDRLTVFLQISNDQQGDAARLRDSLARKVLARAEAAFDAGKEKDTEPVGPVEATPDETYEPFLLKKAEFGDVRDFKQRTLLRTVLGDSLTRRRQACVQEIWMPDGELRSVEYLLCESPLEACAVMFHDALTAAVPGRLLAEGPHSDMLQAFGGKESVDDVYLFRGSTSGDDAGMMVRKGRLLVRVHIANALKGAAEKTRDALARLVLARANDVFGNGDKNTDACAGQ